MKEFLHFFLLQSMLSRLCRDHNFEEGTMEKRNRFFRTGIVAVCNVVILAVLLFFFFGGKGFFPGAEGGCKAYRSQLYDHE